MSAILTALAEMVRHVCPESGPNNAAEAVRAHEHLSALSQPALREMDALRDKARAADAILAEPASIPPAIVAALYPGQPDARPSVADVCAEIEQMWRARAEAFSEDRWLHDHANLARAIVARLRARATSEQITADRCAEERPAYSSAARHASNVLLDEVARLERDHAPSAPVERMWTRAEVLAFGERVRERVCFAVIGDVLNAEPSETRSVGEKCADAGAPYVRLDLAALLDAPSAKVGGR